MDLVTFTEKIYSRKLHCLCSGGKAKPNLCVRSPASLYLAFTFEVNVTNDCQVIIKKHFQQQLMAPPCK